MKRAVLLSTVLLVAVQVSAAIAQTYTPETLKLEDIDFVKKSVAKRLKDPDSAKFLGEFSAAKEDGNDSLVVCGRVNAKNSFGAYAGASPFYVVLTQNMKGNDLYYALVTLIGGSGVEPEVVLEMCKQGGVPYL